MRAFECRVGSVVRGAADRWRADIELQRLEGSAARLQSVCQLAAHQQYAGACR